MAGSAEGTKWNLGWGQRSRRNVCSGSRDAKLQVHPSELPLAEYTVPAFWRAKQTTWGLHLKVPGFLFYFLVADEDRRRGSLLTNL